MAVTVGTSVAGQTGSGTSYTSSSITVASNSNRILYYFVTYKAASATLVSSGSLPTRGDQTATRLAGRTYSYGGFDLGLEIWRIVGVNTGAATTSFTFASAPGGDICIGQMSVYNADQTTPESAFNGYDLYDIVHSGVAPTTSTDDLAILATMGSMYSNTTCTPRSPATTVIRYGEWSTQWIMKSPGGATNTTVIGDTNATNTATMLAFAIRPSAGSSAVVPLFMNQYL